MIIPRILFAVSDLSEAGAVLHQTCLTDPTAHVLEGLARECDGPVLEIGTKHGLTAALFALCGHKVVTVDVEPSPYAAHVWRACGVEERVLSVTTGRVPPRIPPYRTAFVDAVHTHAGCAAHWEAIRPHLADGATLLFDDMDYGAGEGGRFWLEMGAEQFGRFGRLVLP